jgi:DNA sulfur modification protein DndB
MCIESMHIQPQEVRAVATIILDCLVGRSAGRAALLGFAPANVLHALSFADVLDETMGRGYQRRFNSRHSLDFRRYIQQDQSATIPLTFNLRPRTDGAWSIVDVDEKRARLEVASEAGKVLAQVDCQHRLGHLADLDVELPFMSYVGLSEREEMEVFNVINSKAKGLSASLLDFHDAQLASDLVGDRPELFVALYLNNEISSPWYRQLDLGGNSTSGLGRRASLRTMQKAVKVFLNPTRVLSVRAPDATARLVLDFWGAVACVVPTAWSKPRKHLLTKGIGVYALMEIAADFCLEASPSAILDRHYFAAALADFAAEFDWTSDGALKGLGGEGGVKAAVTIIREARRRRRVRMVVNG